MVYTDFVQNLAHAQTVCTRPSFSPMHTNYKGQGTKLYPNWTQPFNATLHMHVAI